MYNEQSKVILKCRVWDAEGDSEAGNSEHGDLEKSNYNVVNRHSRALKNKNSKRKTMQTEKVSGNSTLQCLSLPPVIRLGSRVEAAWTRERTFVLMEYQARFPAS